MTTNYTGIGSRKTPDNSLELMIKLGNYFAKLGYVLRSGGADGADSAFEKGCDQVKGLKEIYLPWRNFNKNNSDLYISLKEAYILAEKYHPAWYNCSEGAKKLHARNVHQVLGKDLNFPSNFVVCWSNGTGGTEQALRIAREYNVKIINLFMIDNFDEIVKETE